MDFINNHPKLVLIVASAAIVGFVVIGLASQAIKTSSDPTAPTSFTSSFTGSSDSLAVNYGLDIQPNQDAVIQRFRIFTPDQISLPDDIKSKLSAIIATALQHVAIPTATQGYVQVDRSTINCPNSYDCHFSFYLDSPESYYNLRIYNRADGTQTYSITAEPLPEGAQS